MIHDDDNRDDDGAFAAIGARVDGDSLRPEGTNRRVGDPGHGAMRGVQGRLEKSKGAWHGVASHRISDQRSSIWL